MVAVSGKHRSDLAEQHGCAEQYSQQLGVVFEERFELGGVVGSHRLTISLTSPRRFNYI